MPKITKKEVLVMRGQKARSLCCKLWDDIWWKLLNSPINAFAK